MTLRKPETTVCWFLPGFRTLTPGCRVISSSESTFYRDLSTFVNVQGTWNILEASIRRGVRALVHTSTNATLHNGTAGIAPRTEADVLKLWQTTTPTSGYGLTKKAATQLVLANNFANEQLRTAALMPGLVLGPREPRMLGVILNGAAVHPLRPEQSGKLNYCHVSSLAKAQLLTLDRLLANDARVAGHLFMMSDFVENIIQLDINLRKALKRPAHRTLGLPLLNALSSVSVFVNWLTNDRLNNPFLQLTPTAVSMIQHGPVYQSTAEAEQALGWKPVTQDALIQELVQYYGIKQ